ncbi:MAG TPA: GWxTD domain-containing protein, partial [Candidatus Limnocylindrales bacterium]|nr:GWxTD domain-containing protein [Candidatus Limnocylindrales bacterium]
MRASSSSFARLGSLSKALILGAACLWSATASAQYQNPGPPSQPETPTPGTSAGRPRFSVDATLQLGESGKPTVRLDYRLSRSELLFERTPPAGYHAAYEVRVVFFSAKGKRQIAGDSYTRELSAPTYSATRQRGEDITDHIDFQVPPGKYRIEMVITDLEAEHASGTAIDFEVPSAPPGLIWFSDLSLGTAETAAVGAPATFVPNPSRRYGENIAAFAAAGEIFDRRASAADSSYRIYYKVISDTGEQLAAGDTTFPRSAGRTSFLLRPRLGNVGAGSYRLVVAMNTPADAGIKDAKNNQIRRDKSFDVDQSRATVGFASAQSVDVLRYVATQPESNEIGRLQTEEDRKAYWEAFWKKRDPTPETPENEARDEFYQRVQYANQHFRWAGVPGWKMDMG